MRRLLPSAGVAALAVGVSACWLTASFSNLQGAGSPDAAVRDSGHDGTTGRQDATPDAPAPRDASHDAHDAARDGLAPPGDGGAKDVAATDVRGPEAGGHDAGAGDAHHADATGIDAMAHDSGIRDTGADTGSAPDASCTTATTYPEAVLAAGPLAYWRLDESAGPTATDLTTNHNNATYSSTGVTYAQGGVVAGDKSVLLDGTAGELTVSGTFNTTSQFDGTQSYSIEAWIDPMTIDTSYRGILSNEEVTDAGRAGWAFYIQSTAGLGFDRYYEDTSTPLTSAGSVTEGAWYHVVAVYDATGTTKTMTLYVNGSSVISVATTLSIVGGCQFAIGATHCGMTGWFSGNMQDVAVYDYPLAPACIAAHNTLGRTAL